MAHRAAAVPSPVSAGPAERLDRELACLDAAEAVALLARRHAGRIALLSSFGADSAVLLHLVARADPAMPVLLLDTGKLFPETLAHRDALIAQLGLRDVRSIAPDPVALAARDPFGGLRLLDPDACCALRKTEPLARALAPFDLWLNGRRRAQGGERGALRITEATAEGKIKVNPLAAWGDAEIAGYAAEHGLPAHPLVISGYASIGCAPCTSPVAPGEAARAGRWRGTGKSECGIHRPPSHSPSSTASTHRTP